MSRIARIVIPGIPHHVTHRGNCRQRIFLTDSDQQIYMQLLNKYFRKYGVDLTGFSLMPNHVHHIVIPSNVRSLAKGVGLLHNDFSRLQNIKSNKTGHIWENRFYSNPLDEEHFWAALRYAELNPVRAGLVKNAWDWPWSSARAHVTACDSTGLLNMDVWRSRFNEHQWKDYLLEGLNLQDEIESLRLAARTGRPLGNKSFINDLEALTGKTLIPRHRGPKPSSEKK